MWHKSIINSVADVSSYILAFLNKQFTNTINTYFVQKLKLAISLNIETEIKLRDVQRKQRKQCEDQADRIKFEGTHKPNISQPVYIHFQKQKW